MFRLAKDLQRFHDADTENVYDAVPLIPSRRGSLEGVAPSEERWWSPPRELGADFATARHTDVVHLPTKWLVVTPRFADRLDALGRPFRRTEVVLVDYDLDRSKRRGGAPLPAYALDVEVVAEHVDRLRSTKKDTVFTLDPAELPPVFRRSAFDSELWVSPEGALAFEEARGVKLVPVSSTPRFAGLTETMRQVRDGSLEAASLTTAALTAVDAHGFTALHHAAEVDSVDALAALLAEGAAIDVTSVAGVTALGVAAFLGHTASVDTLLAHGADVSAGVWSAAQWAACAGHVELCARSSKLLPETSASPLELAVRENQDAVALCLLEFTRTTEAERAAALTVALTRRRGQVALALMQRVPFPTAEADRAKWLDGAARSGLPELLDFVLDRGVDVDTRGSIGGTTLRGLAWLATRHVVAGRAMDLATLEHLLRRGADPNLRPPKGRSALEEVDHAIHEARLDPYAGEEELASLETLRALLAGGG